MEKRGNGSREQGGGIRKAIRRELIKIGNKETPIVRHLT
jgi:hypothetical protein